MSGHSKWSKVKHQKETTDAVKGKIFTKLANAISVAVRQGGGPDPAANFRLRLAIERARMANMPKDKITRAIERGKGGAGEQAMEELVYEAFGPGGVGILIEVTTDNKQRSAAHIKNVLDRFGGALAGSGAVSYLFEPVGVLEVAKEEAPFEELFELISTANALDAEEGNLQYTVYSLPSELHTLKSLLAEKEWNILNAELSYRVKLPNRPADESHLKQLEQLFETLDELDDVQRVFSTAVFDPA